LAIAQLPGKAAKLHLLLQKYEKSFRPQGEVSWEGGMTTFFGGKCYIQLEKENSPCTMKSLIYL